MGRGRVLARLELGCACGAESASALVRQFYASGAGSDGYKRFSNAWTASTDADCANEDVFNVNETAVFSSKPFVNAAFAYDCVVALAAAMYVAGANASGAQVFEAFTNVSFEGATGTVAFEPNGDRLASTVRYAVDVWRSSGSELSVTSVGSFSVSSGYTSASSGYTSSDDTITWPRDAYAPPDAFCSAEDYECALILVPSPLAPRLTVTSSPRPVSPLPLLPGISCRTARACNGRSPSRGRPAATAPSAGHW